MTSMNEPILEEWRDDWMTKRGQHYTLITPELAEKLLERNWNNRKAKPLMITQYARDMKNGKWDADASDLKFALTGELLDGQNRLMACIQAGVPFPTLVRFGLQPQAKAHIDTGAKRTIADALKMSGVHGEQTAIGAAVNVRHRFVERMVMFGRSRGMDYKSDILTHQEVLDYLAAHPMVEKFAPSASWLRKRVLPSMPTSALLAALSMFAEVDEPMTAEFVNKLLTGNYGGPGDPFQALVAYAALYRGRQTGSPGARGREAQERHLMALIKVWNAWRTGQKFSAPLRVWKTEKLVTPI